MGERHGKDIPRITYSLFLTLCVSVSHSHSLALFFIPLQSFLRSDKLHRLLFFMFGCCRRGINLLFVAVNQISTDRFKLIASVSWSHKERALQALISFYLFSKWYPHQWHMQTESVLIFLCVFFRFYFLKCCWRNCKEPWTNVCDTHWNTYRCFLLQVKMVLFP